LGVPDLAVPSPMKDETGRELYGTEELAIVLSHFEIGVIDRVRAYPRGSRKAPKLLIEADSGTYLLKRRARGRDDPFKVAFCHQIQLHLAEQQFPLPHLIGTRRDNNSMLQLEGSGERNLPGAIYELFEYIPGKPYPQTLESTFDSGKVQALYHKLLDGFHSEFDPPRGSYHRAPAVPRSLKTISEQMAGKPAVRAACRELHGLYQQAADAADGEGLKDWPDQIVHGDWHPGNMLFRDDHVVAVIDYDSARRLPRIIDAANGALQFSILGGGDDVTTWPDGIDSGRFKRFVRGYDKVALLSRAELRATVPLMIEALIAEAVFPIAATGTFGRLDGEAFLDMVRRKVNWLRAESAGLIELVEG
jgi:homoserine kinase type II